MLRAPGIGSVPVRRKPAPITFSGMILLLCDHDIATGFVIIIFVDRVHGTEQVCGFDPILAFVFCFNLRSIDHKDTALLKPVIGLRRGPDALPELLSRIGSRKISGRYSLAQEFAERFPALFNLVNQQSVGWN